VTGPGVERPVALVTGGARRVGRAICLALARAGCAVQFTFRESEVEARGLHAELVGAEPVSEVSRVLAFEDRAMRLDLGDLAGVEALGERLARAWPRLDVLVHNASMYGPTPIERIGAEEMMAHFRVNAAGPLLLTSHLTPLLARSLLPGGGAVVCLCDIHAMGRPRRNHAAYGMSKAALGEMVRTLAVDLAPQVRVNGVAPGVVAFPESGPESQPEMQARYLSRVPLARSGEPQDAAEAVRWLALEARYTTGTIVRVDGGRWLG